MRRRKIGRPFSLFSFQDLVTGLSGVMILLVLTLLLDMAASRSPDMPNPESLEDTLETEKTLSDEIRRLRAELASLKDAAAAARLAVRGAESPEEAEERARRIQEERERDAAMWRSRLAALQKRLEELKHGDFENRAILEEMENNRQALESELEAFRKRAGITLIPERGNLKLPIYVECSGTGFRIHRLPGDGDGSGDSVELSGERQLRDCLGKLDRRTHSVVLLVRPSGTWRMDGAARVAREAGFAVGRDPLEEDVALDFEPLPGEGA